MSHHKGPAPSEIADAKRRPVPAPAPSPDNSQLVDADVRNDVHRATAPPDCSSPAVNWNPPADSPVGAPDCSCGHNIHLHTWAEPRSCTYCSCARFSAVGVPPAGTPPLELLREALGFVPHLIDEDCGNSEGTPCDDLYRQIVCDGHKWLKAVRTALASPSAGRPTKIYEAMREMGKGINCVRLEVPESVAEDLAGRFNQFCNAIDAHFVAEAKAAGTQEDDGVDEQIWLPGGSNYTTDKRAAGIQEEKS